jgi:hypothetical protein
MRVLVTSDLAVGSAFPHVSSVARKLREIRIDTLREIINLANYRKVDALILAGNTLADNRVARDDVIDVIDVLRLSSAPVLVLPGLNDPFTPDNPFRLDPTLLKSPVQIIGKSDSLEVGPSIVVPLPVLSRQALTDQVTSRFQQRASTEKRVIGLACIPPAKIPSADFIEQSGVDVFLCGGSLAQSYNCRLVIPGTPEPLDFDGAGGYVSVVELGAKGTQPSVESISVGRLDWRCVEAEPSGVEQALNIPGPVSARTLLRVEAKGFLAPGEILRLRGLVEDQRRRFVLLEARIGLNPTVPETVPHPLIKDLLNRLAVEAGQWMSQSSHLLAVPSEEEVARWAILRLHELIGESPHEELSCI